jgi:hypothetical protein
MAVAAWAAVEATTKRKTPSTDNKGMAGAKVVGWKVDLSFDLLNPAASAPS